MKHIKKFNESNSFNDLKTKLLSYGGTKVVETYEEDLDKLLNRGQIFNVDSTIVKMKDSRCHFNSANFWRNYTDKNGYDNCFILTGWALSDDSFWRQHTAIYLQKTDDIIETTVE